MVIIMVVKNVMSTNDQYHQEEEEDELPSPKSMADYDRPNIRCFVSVNETKSFFTRGFNFSMAISVFCDLYFYRTRVRSLATLVTHFLTPCRLVDLMPVTLACEDANSDLFRVLLLLMLMLFGHKFKFVFRL